MKRIESFQVNHDVLNPGIYISRVDYVADKPVTTFDIRMVKPNSSAMEIKAMHTIEHLGATYFRNREDWKDLIVYFGPMGCCTGFYLILAGDYPIYSDRHLAAIKLIIDMFDFCTKFKGKIPGTTSKECGNFRLHDLKTAQNYTADMLVRFYDLCLLDFEYPTGDLETDRIMNERAEIKIRKNVDLINMGVMTESSLFHIEPDKLHKSDEKHKHKVKRTVSKTMKKKQDEYIVSSNPLF